MNNQTKVFILGAGCSADCGYPLGIGFANELEKFLIEISDKCPVIKQCVTDTLKLLVGLPEIQTLDQLAKRLEDVKPAPDHFCFLKLHGSASWWGQRQQNHNTRHYLLPSALNTVSLEEIENSIPAKGRDTHSGWESLIVFPHERQFAQDYSIARGEPSGYPWAEYIDTVWDYAAALLEVATEVRVIGYSFNPIDSRYVVDKLLTKVKCDKIAIQNLDIDTVKKNLASYKMLRGRLEFDQTPF